MGKFTYLAYLCSRHLRKFDFAIARELISRYLLNLALRY